MEVLPHLGLSAHVLALDGSLVPTAGQQRSLSGISSGWSSSCLQRGEEETKRAEWALRWFLTFAASKNRLVFFPRLGNYQCLA